MAHSARSEAWKRVTKHDPCPICESDHWCKVSPDGAFVCCMWNSENAYRLGRLKTGEPYAVHRLRDDRPYEPQSPTCTIPTPEDDAGFAVLTARAVYAVTAAHCAAEIPDFVRAELVRRFGPVYGPLAIERFGLGYCNPPQLVKALDAAGRRTEALAAGVLHPQRGQAVHSLAGRLTIPYRRGGGVLDIRGAGIKGRGETKEMSLPGGYIERDVAGLFFNHDALDNLAPGEPVHIAGGAYKTMALALCELPAIGTRGEAELSDAQIAALQAAGVTAVVLHIDAEEAKEGERLSSGRRLGLPKAERLAAAGFVVAIAEPPREPGTPKVDPDALLRDFGVRAVRNYALSALPLAAWRVLIGADTAPAPHLLAERDTMIATLRADVARLGDQVRATDRELAEVREARDFYRRCLDCPDPVLGRALPVMAEELHRAYQQGAPLVQDGHEFVRLRFERAAEGKPINRGAVATAAARLGSDTPHLTRPATVRRNGQEQPTTHHYFSCPVEDRLSVARLGLGLLNRATPQPRHSGRKPPKIMPPAVAEQTAPVRREQRHVETFFSLRDDTQLATQTTIGTADYWTPEGEQLTQEAARAWQVAHGVRAAVETQHTHVAPPRLFVGERPPARPTVEFQQSSTHVNSAQTQQWEPAPTAPGQCRNADCGAPVVQGGYCLEHYRAHAEAHRRRFGGGDYASAVGDE